MSSFFATIFSSPARTKEEAPRPSSTPRRKHLQPPASPLKGHLLSQTVSKAPSTRKSVTFKVPILEETPPRLPPFDTPHEDDEDKENATVEPSPLAVSPQDMLQRSSPCPSPGPSPKTSRRKRASPGKNTSKDEQSKSTGATDENTDADEDEVEESFERFIGYQWDGADLELHVEWTSGELSWEPESNLYRDAPHAVLEYYNDIGGRPKNPDDPLLYDVHAILKHSPDRKKVLVEWVGFGPKEATWEPRHAIAKAAPEISTQYWAEQSKKTRARSKARGRRRA